MRELPSRKRSTFKPDSKKSQKKMGREKDKLLSKKKNPHLSLISPDNDRLMKNISVSFRGNRGVRFSNDIETLEISEGPILRKSKLSEVSGQTCKTIQNQLSEEQIGSVNLSEHKKSEESLKEK